ncbi:MAG: asparagine synthase (glutamine-hydrolyzing) [Candidatus Andersenbacteria bacterium]
MQGKLYPCSMCGIVGMWDRQSANGVDTSLLSTMATAIAHRGPDDQGLYVDGNLGLAHRRLAILDLSSLARQPMSTPDRQHTIVFNGEIYNFRELQQRYLRDVPLVSTSDTEVLLHLLARQGVAALSLLRGMFSFAWWNRQQQTLILARDPFGKKPLYYFNDPHVFLFASEPKSLLLHPRVSRQLQPSAVSKYFLYEYVPAPTTIYRDIHQIPLGHYAFVTDKEFSVREWWRPTYLPKRQFTSEDEAGEQLEQKLRVAISRRQVADVPVGVFLSGGLDSTAITAYLADAGKQTHSFSVSFNERSFDESQYAYGAARALQTIHHTVKFNLKSFHETLAAVGPSIDIPLADASLLPMYQVSKIARRYITVGLDGDGSDELFAGYGTFSAAIWAERLRWLPAWATILLQQVVNLYPPKYSNFSFDFKLKSFLKGLGYPLGSRNQIWLGSFTEREMQDLLQPQWHTPGSLFSDIEALAPRMSQLETLDAVSLLTVVHYLHNDILVKLDRAAMMVSLEARTPFLDIDLAEFVMRLPAHLKRNKYLLKKIMRGRIPAEIIDRPKKGFGIPLGYWLKGPLYDWATTVLNSSKLAADGVLQPAAVQRLLYEHKRGRHDHRKKLWTLLTWQLWYDRWIAQRSYQ